MTDRDVIAITMGIRGRSRGAASVLRGLYRSMIAIVVLPAVALSQDSLAQGEPPGRLIDIGGYRMHLLCTGRSVPGRPTAILSAGGGGLAVDWALVQPGIAGSARVCSYDRANEGWSDPGPNPRTLQQEVYELHAALRAAGENPPYVMVGHSLGGLVVRLYAQSYPEEVIGAVLLEPTHESAQLGYRGSLVRVRTLATDRPVPSPRGLREAPPEMMTGDRLQECEAQAASEVIYGPFAKLPSAAQAMRLWVQRHPTCVMLSEDLLPEELHQIWTRRQSESQPLGDMPLIVVAGAQISVPPGADAAAWRREKMDHMMDLARLSRNGRLVTEPAAGHSLHLEAPSVVIATVNEVVRRSTR